MIKKLLDDSRHPVKIWTDEIEDQALKQLRNLGNLPFIFKHVAVMPDVHAGKGSTIGAVIATQDAIIPAAVGVDIGCGMQAVRLEGIKPAHLEGKLRKIRRAIEKVIPLGFDVHKGERGFKALNAKERDNFVRRAEAIERRARDKSRAKASTILKGLMKFPNALGSLGGGNHFIEICVSTTNEVWLMFHTGSRGTGKLIADHYIAVAKDLCRAVELADPDLAYLRTGSQEFDDYLTDMHWAQDFAALSRKAIRRLILQELRSILPFQKNPEKFEIIDCHHNYVAQEEHYGEEVLVTRKGAVRAGLGDLGIIPGSMGAKSFIVSGLGQPESFHSCSHGAGRKMSRNQARKTFSTDDLSRLTAGVECRKDEDVLDEIPAAYKDIAEVMANQTDLVEVLHELKQVICVKG